MGTSISMHAQHSIQAVLLLLVILVSIQKNLASITNTHSQTMVDVFNDVPGLIEAEENENKCAVCGKDLKNCPTGGKN
ncbi:hypothetical protein PGTUg99_012428 [Puccinia graminis f. sp. tritici]|nr:hypothetical protein PGTUg99_012428 [Puccinia graminis f. sp. tritici]